MQTIEINGKKEKAVLYRNLLDGVKIFALKGEYKKPLAGEYYLSGAKPRVYFSKNNLSSKFYVVRFVKVKFIETIIERYKIIKD